jgi:hypothetical protein
VDRETAETSNDLPVQPSMSTAVVADQGSEQSEGAPQETVPRSSRRLIGAVTAFCFAVPAALYLWVIQAYGVNVIWGDQWTDVKLINASYSGNLTLSTLWTQHNEERNLFSNIIVVILAHTTHLNLFVEMYLSAALLFAAIALIILVHKRRAPDTALIYYWPVAILLLSLVQYGDTLWGFQIAWYIVVLALAVSLYFLDRKRLTALALSGAVLAAVVGSFSLFQGLLIWPTGLVLIYYRRRSIAAAAIWIGSAIVTAVVYFFHYNNNAPASTHHGVPYALHHLLASAQFFFTAIGDVVGTSIPRRGNDAVLTIGVLIVALAIWVVLRHGLRRDEESPRVIGIAFICFGLLYVFSFTLGRAVFGITFAGTSIYRIDTLFIVVGIYLGLIGPSRVEAGEGASQHRRLLGRQWDGIITVVVALVIVVQIVSGLITGFVGVQARRSDMIHTENVILNINKAPDNVVYGIFYVGVPDFVRQMVPILRADKLTFFDSNLPEIERGKEGLLLGAWDTNQTSPVEPWRGLENGQVVVVHDAGFTGSIKKPIVIAECNPKILISQMSACDMGNAVTTHAGAGGTLNSTFTVRTGPVGGGVCDSTHPCYVMAWQPASHLQGIAEIDFAVPRNGKQSGA